MHMHMHINMFMHTCNVKRVEAHKAHEAQLVGHDEDVKDAAKCLQ